MTSNKIQADMNPSESMQEQSSREETPDRKLPADSPKKLHDKWFDQQLNQLFNDASSEPLPPELAKLVSKLRDQGPKSNG